MELRLPPHIEKQGDVYISKLTRRTLNNEQVERICHLYWINNKDKQSERDAIITVSPIKGITKRKALRKQPKIKTIPIKQTEKTISIIAKIEIVKKCPVCGGSGEIELIMFDTIKCRCKK